MNGDTLLLRQVSPSWVRGNRATSQAFAPTPKDAGQLSAYDGDRITAETSWRHFTSALGYASVGVLAVTVDECDASGAPARPDPYVFPEHVLIDFNGLTRAQRKDAAKTLARHANDRGWQFGPVGTR